MFNCTSKGGLDGLIGSAIAYHSPYFSSGGLEAGSKEAGTAFDGFFAVHLQYVSLENGFLPGFIAHFFHKQVRDDAALPKAKRRAGDGGGVDHEGEVRA